MQIWNVNSFPWAKNSNTGSNTVILSHQLFSRKDINIKILISKLREKYKFKIVETQTPLSSSLVERLHRAKYIWHAMFCTHSV